MTTDLPFLRSYEDWKDCITRACRIPLTLAFVETRLALLADTQDFGTQRFVQVWGEAHLARVKSWFLQAREELNRGEQA